MEENHKLEIERLINLKKTMKSDVKSMEQMFSLYMNEKISICSFCAAQIKMAQKRLYNWYSSQINNNIPPPPSTIEQKQGCQSCKQKGRPKK